MKKLTRFLAVMLALTLLFTLSAPLTADAATVKKPVKVTSVKASSVTTTKATISYKKATRAKGYQIQYSTKSSMKSAKTVKTTKLKKTLTGLKSNTAYYVRVRAYNTSSKKKTQYGAWSKAVKTKTAIAKPAQVKSVKTSSIKTTSAAVTYAKATRAKGYQIQYSTKSSMASAKTVKTSKTSATLKSLKSNTKYYVRVRAYNTSSSKKTQYGAWSAKQSFTTKKTTSTASTRYSIKYVDNMDQHKNISYYLWYSVTENPASYTSADSITLENPTCVSYFNGSRTLYLFDGWYSDKACTKRVTKIAKGTKGNLTFYAKWKPKTFKVKYVLNDSADAPAKNVGNPSTYYFGENRPLKAPTRDGYVFAGWYQKDYPSHIIENFNDDFAYEDITLYAKWRTIGTGTISYNLNYKAAWELTTKNMSTDSGCPGYEVPSTGSSTYRVTYNYQLKEGTGTGYSGEPLLQPSLPNANFVGWEVTYCSTSDFSGGEIITSLPKGYSGRLLNLTAVYSDRGLEAKRQEILNDSAKNDLEKIKTWANELVHGYYTYGSHRDLNLADYTALSDKYISKYGFFNTGTCYGGAIKIKEFCDDLGVRCVLRFAGNDTVPGKTYTGTDHRNTYVWYDGKRYCIGATPSGGSEQFEVTKDMIQYLPDYYDYTD